MSMTGEFFDKINSALGPGAITGGYRSQAEQDKYFKMGVTPAQVSTHTNNTPDLPNGYDIRANIPEATARANLAKQGLQITKWHPEGGGYHDGTGPHNHIEVMPMGATVPATTGGRSLPNQSVPGTGIVNPSVFLDGLAKGLGPEQRSAAPPSDQNAPQNAVINAAGPAEAAGVAEQRQKIGHAEDVLAAVTHASTIAQAVQTSEQAKLVDKSTAINQTMSDATRHQQEAVAPVFAARARISDQLDAVNSMNPLLRGIKGVFDLNYDQKYLEGQLDHYDRTIKARSDDYAYTKALHADALQQIGQQFNLATAGPDLALKQFQEQAGIAGQSLVLASQSLSATRESVSDAQGLIQARNMAQTAMLGKLDRPTILDLLGQAQKSPTGDIKFNGVTFTPHQLFAEANHRDEQDILVQNYKISAANGIADLTTKNATNIARSLTPAQADQAMQNGGVVKINGVDINLPQDVLANVVQAQKQMAGAQAEAAANKFGPGVALDTAGDITNGMQATWRRQAQIIGPRGNPVGEEALREATDITNKIVEAHSQNRPPEVIAGLVGQLQKTRDKFLQGADEGFVRAAGGDLRTANLMKSFASGAPIDSSTATAGIAHFAARGGFPEGMAASPEARQVILAAQQIARENAIDPKSLKHRSQAELENIISQELPGKAANIVGGARFNRIYSNMPQNAAAIGDPFGKFDPDMWRRITSQAEVDGDGVLAAKLNTTPDVALKLRTGKFKGDSPSDKALLKAYDENKDAFNAGEYKSLILGMNDAPAIQPGMRNSDIYVSMLNNPKLYQGVDVHNRVLAGSSMGDYLAEPISAGATTSAFRQYAGQVDRIQGMVSFEARKASRAQAMQYAGDPIMRSSIVMGSIQGVGKEGAKALLPTIQHIVKQKAAAGNININSGSAMQSGKPTSQVQADDEVIVGALANMKFPDARLEAFRKSAVKGWAASAVHSDGIIDDMHQWLTGTNTGN